MEENDIEKNKTKLFIVIFIGVIIILGLSGYIVYDNLVQKEEVYDSGNNNNDNSISDIDSVEYKLGLELYDKVTGLPGCVDFPRGDNMIDYYIEEKITPSIILKVGYMNAIEVKNSYNGDGSLVEQKIKEIFGTNTNYKLDNLYYPNGSILVNYNKNSNKYEVIDGCGSDPWTDEQNILTKVSNVKKDDNKIYVTEKMIYEEIFCLYDEKTESSYCNTDLYKDYKKTTKIKSINKSITMDNYIEVDEYIKDGSTYLYTFTEENGNYYFTDFKKID